MADLIVNGQQTPFLRAWPFAGAFGTAFTDPATLPADGDLGKVSLHPTKAYLAAGTHDSPFCSVYEYTEGSGFGAKLADPGTLPSGNGRKAAFSPDGDYLALSQVGFFSPPVQVWNFAGAWGTKVTDPAGFGFSFAEGHGTAWAPDSDAIAVAVATTPYVRAWPWSAGFGTMATDPATLPTGIGRDIAFSPDGAYIAVAHDTSPYVTVYPWNGTAFGAKVADPASLPAGNGIGVAWSPDGNYIAIAHTTTPYVSVYEWNAGFGAKVSDPASLPTGNGQGVAWAASSAFIAITHETSPYISVYPWSGSFGAKVGDPATLPPQEGLSVVFSDNPTGFAPPGTTPSVIAGPTVDYGDFTRTGVNNTPWGLGFTPSDDDTTGVDALTWQVRTATGGGGTLVASGTCTHLVPVSTTIAYNASGLVNGTQTLYVHLSDGTLTSDTVFTLKRDDDAPLSASSVSTDPSSVLIDELPDYTVTFTPDDVLSTEANELRYEIRTAAGGAGTLLADGTATADVQEISDSVIDDDLVEGQNTRYIRVIDGANNATDTAFTVLAELNPPSDDEVDEGLSGPSVSIFFTFEKRTIDFGFLEDLTPAIRNCTVECINERDTALTASFDVDELLLPADFDPDNAFIAVNATLRLPTFDKLFTIGLFRLDVADVEREPGSIFWPDVQGTDLTDILETLYFDEPFSVDAGDSVLDACIALVEGAGLIADFPDDDTNSSATFPVGRIYDPQRSKRNILNDMLVNCIHWKKAHTTPTGRITSRYNQRPTEEPVAQVYSTTQEPRLIGLPFRVRPRRQGRINRAVALIDDPRRDPEYVFLENADTTSPVSTENLGASKPQEIDASFAIDLDLAEEMATHFLMTEASKAVEADLVTAFDPRRQPHETYKLNIHDDLLDEDVENGTLWNVLSWRLEIAKDRPGAPMQHRIVRAASPTLTEVA